MTTTPDTNRQGGHTVAWRRWGTIAAMICTLVLGPPAHAADAAADTATFKFVAADIESVVRAIGQFMHMTFLIDPRIKGTVNLVTEKPVSRSQALKLLTAVLRMQGYAMVEGDGFTKIVPEVDAKLQLGATEPAKVRGDQIATRVFKLKYESAANIGPVLRPLISANNTINVDAGSNSLVITDYHDNLARMATIIDRLDQPAVSATEVVAIQHAVASDVAVMVTRLMESTNPLERVSLLPDARTNSVIVRAPSLLRAAQAKALIEKLDQPTVESGNVHVVHLRNAEATRLAQTLRAVVSSDTSALTTSPTTSSTPLTPSTSGSTPGPLAPASAASPAPAPLAPGGAGGFIQADATTNTLIITASEPVYRGLREVIDRLDQRRAQVLVESLIVEVSANKAADIGVQWMGASGDKNSSYRIGGLTSFSTGGNNIVNQALSQLTTGVPLPPGNGLTVGIIRQVAGQINLGALAHALETDANANILSMPNVITLDNEEARIMVGQNVPFVTGQYTTPASAGAVGVNPFQTVERKDIGLSLRVRPQISEGDTVKMTIYQETSAVQDTSNPAGIITSKRSIDTNVLVDDGQIIVLGGLIEENMQDGNEKVPGLGDIPVLGGLFNYQTRKRVKTNLMVFLRPTVIRDTAQSSSAAVDRYDFMRNEQIKGQPAPRLLLPNTGVPVLPPLENGKPVGGTFLPPLMPNTPQPLVPPYVEKPN